MDASASSQRVVPGPADGGPPLPAMVQERAKAYLAGLVSSEEPWTNATVLGALRTCMELLMVQGSHSDPSVSSRVSELSSHLSLPLDALVAVCLQSSPTLLPRGATRISPSISSAPFTGSWSRRSSPLQVPSSLVPRPRGQVVSQRPPLPRHRPQRLLRSLPRQLQPRWRAKIVTYESQRCLLLASLSSPMSATSVWKLPSASPSASRSSIYEDAPRRLAAHLCASPLGMLLRRLWPS